MSAEVVLDRVHEVILFAAAARPVEVWCPILRDWPSVASVGSVLRCEGCQQRLVVDVVASADGVSGVPADERRSWLRSGEETTRHDEKLVEDLTYVLAASRYQLGSADPPYMPWPAASRERASA